MPFCEDGVRGSVSVEAPCFVIWLEKEAHIASFSAGFHFISAILFASINFFHYLPIYTMQKVPIRNYSSCRIFQDKGGRKMKIAGSNVSMNLDSLGIR